MSEIKTIKLELDNLDLETVFNNPQEILDQIEVKHKDCLDDFLLSNLSDIDGSPSIENYAITNFTIDESDQKGKFRLHFEVQRRFCCSGTEACQKDYIDASIYCKNEQLILTAEYFDWTLTN